MMLIYQKLSGLTEHLLESGLVTNGVLAQDTTQLQSLWAVRETIGESAGKAGAVYKYDVSVPVGKMYDVVEKVRTRLGEAGLLGSDWQGRLGVYQGGRVLAAMGYGHMGDGQWSSAETYGSTNGQGISISTLSLIDTMMRLRES
jgi:FAD/FMN-containing dehydrogenase